MILLIFIIELLNYFLSSFLGSFHTIKEGVPLTDAMLTVHVQCNGGNVKISEAFVNIGGNVLPVTISLDKLSINDYIGFRNLQEDKSYIVKLEVISGDTVITEKMTIKTKQPTSIIHNGTLYNFVTSPHTGRIWLDRNLGATQVCTSFNDTACYGDYYQWGRDFDGHESKTTGDTTIRMTNINNVGSDFVYQNWDWVENGVDTDGSLRSAKWQKTDGSSVCPVGYYVPTIAELAAETIAQGMTTKEEAFASFLKLPAAGYHDGDDNGLLNNVNTFVNVLSSTPQGTEDVRDVQIDGGDDSSRGDGRSVRCIKL